MIAHTTLALNVSLVFAAVLVAGVLLKLWLASRQIRYVAQHRQAVPAAFAGSVDLAAHQKAADYTVARMRMSILDVLLAAVFTLGWTLLGGLDALNQILLARLGGGMAQQLALLAAFTLINGLLEMPLSLYQTFVLEQRFGFNRTTLRLWLSDLLKSSLLAALIGLPLAALILWLMGAAGPAWWLWTWLVWVTFNLLLLLVYPSFVAPLFNRFEPLQDEAVRERVTRLMERCGFRANGLFVMDGSRRSAHANAYFTGFGASRRVVFFDTLLTQLSPGQIEAVLAHELGHFRRRHVLQRMAALFLASLAGLALLGWLAGQAWFYAGLGVMPNLDIARSAPNDALALLLFLLVTPVFSTFITPLWSQLSRRHEFEADAFAATNADGRDLAAALLCLYRDNASTLTPDPVFARFYYSHPPAAERLARLPA
jgi:STE24 endopeptidase